jgi:hypothetical protein
MPQSKDKAPTPNDQRSNSKNPTSPEKKAADDNRSNQLNPQRSAPPPQQPDPKR